MGEDDPTLPPAGPPGQRPRPEATTRPAHPGSAPGEDIGPYRLLEVLGEGGFGVVYLAERREPFVQRVALKIIKPGMDSRAVVARFEQERQSLAVLDHPHIARIYDAGVVAPGGRPYFVMEHVAGEPLAAFASSRRLGVAERVRLLVPVCDAVHHAHTRGLVHRDLKPANILVCLPDPRGEPFPKVIDFGVARALSHTLADKTVYTQQGAVVGTPDYMSPEQAAGAPELGPASDIYSLGVVLFELLTGALPREIGAAGVAPADLPRLFQVRARRLRDVDPTLSPDLETIVLRCMADEPGRRYASAADVAEDLRRFLDGRPILARRDHTLYVVRTRARRLARRQPLAAMALVWVLTALASRYVVLPALFEWTSLGAAFDHLLVGRAGRAVTGFDTARVLMLADGAEPEQLGALAGVEGVTRDGTGLRPVHTEVLRRLARAGPRVVALDLVFRAPSAHDTALRAAMQEAQAAGVEVVSAVRTWPIAPGEVPNVAPFMLEGVGVPLGGISKGTDEAGDPVAHIFARRGPAPPFPSLALRAFAASEAPGWEPAIDLVRGTDLVQLYFTRPGKSGAVMQHERIRRIMTLSVQPVESDIPEVGLRAGDEVGLMKALVPSSTPLDEATMTYDRLLGATDADLRAWCEGKIVVVGDARAATRDLVTLRDGRIVPGCQVMATLIEQLAQGWSVVRPGPAADRAGLALAAVAGTILGSAFAGRPVRRWIGLLAVIALMVGGAMALYALRAVYANPIVAGVAVIVAGEFTALMLGPRPRAEGGLSS
ncbi:MAG: CHASE2 domain-containing protein [Leptolyngbya sp. PLA1]|nr:CHASE2 domain-containing protein [Leptolyngbya sp. PLA1]